MSKLRVFIVFFWLTCQTFANTDAINNPVTIKQALLVVNRVELTLPTITLLNRRDFLYHSLIGGNVRYYFSENHGLEVRGYYDSYSDTEMSFLADDRQPMLWVASNYVFRPLYGQYLISSNLIQFDVYFFSGVGSKFSESLQPFLNFGIGSHHYLFKDKISLVPELLIRTYPNNVTWINELILNAGISYLF